MLGEPGRVYCEIEEGDAGNLVVLAVRHRPSEVPDISPNALFPSSLRRGSEEAWIGMGAGRGRHEIEQTLQLLCARVGDRSVQANFHLVRPAGMERDRARVGVGEKAISGAKPARDRIVVFLRHDVGSLIVGVSVPP